MIYSKPHFTNFPIKVKFSLRWRNMYLFPQGWGHKKSVAQHRYASEMCNQLNTNVYEHKFFWFTHRYDITWLFFNLTIIILEDYKGMGTSFRDERTVYDTKPLIPVYENTWGKN